MKKRFAALVTALCLALATLPADAACFPRYDGGSGSIAAALDALGADASYASRARIAAANGIDGYRGTAAQNTRMLELLRQGALADPDRCAASPAPDGLTAANLERTSFLRQEKNTCKATSAAMAVNLILGRDRYSTADMIDSGVLCRSLEGERYIGSDGNTYQAAYKTDGYAGSLRELEAAVEKALANGLPIVAAVHSAATRHHWIVIVGRDGQGGCLAVDPARNGAGSMASQARSMASMGYAFGLTDYEQPHYGYISFQDRGKSGTGAGRACSAGGPRARRGIHPGVSAFCGSYRWKTPAHGPVGGCFHFGARGAAGGRFPGSPAGRRRAGSGPTGAGPDLRTLPRAKIPMCPCQTGRFLL